VSLNRIDYVVDYVTRTVMLLKAWSIQVVVKQSFPMVSKNELVTDSVPAAKEG